MKGEGMHWGGSAPPGGEAAAPGGDPVGEVERTDVPPGLARIERWGGARLAVAWFSVLVVLGIFALGLEAAESWKGLEGFAPRSMDRIVCRSGAVVSGRIESLRGGGLQVKVLLGNGRGSAAAERRVALAEVERVVFGAEEGSPAAETPDRAALEDLEAFWEARRPFLRVPGCAAGVAGLELARRLLVSGDAPGRARAVRIAGEIVREDGDPARRSRALAVRWRALLAGGGWEEARSAAEAALAAATDPETQAEARQVLGLTGLPAILALEKAHPRWAEDEEVRAERARLIDGALDHLLHAYLFETGGEDRAAEGLLASSGLLRHLGREADAEACLADLHLLFPDSASARAAGIEPVADQP